MARISIPAIPADTKPGDLIPLVNERLRRLADREESLSPASADLDMAAHRIVSLADPTGGQDAMNLRSADARYQAKAARSAPAPAEGASVSQTQILDDDIIWDANGAPVTY